MIQGSTPPRQQNHRTGRKTEGVREDILHFQHKQRSQHPGDRLDDAGRLPMKKLFDFDIPSRLKGTETAVPSGKF